MRVLLIEDDFAISETIVEMLELNEMQVDTVETCDAALTYLEQEQPDVIVSDVMLPDGSGFDILKVLRERDAIDYTPFIFLSGRAAHEDIRLGMSLGADDYLTKPFEYKDLIRSVTSIYQKLSGKKKKVTALEDELDRKKGQIDQVKSITSHDLRSRIVRISNLVSLMRSGKLSYEVFVDWMIRSGEYLDEVIFKIHDIINTAETLDKTGLLSATPKSIWHVDDDDMQLQVVKSMITSKFKGVDFRSFSKPEEAITHLDNPPDLIFLDINMPKISGFDFLDQLSKRKCKSQVIMLSSSISDTDISKSYTFSQVVGYEVKPLKVDVISQMFGESSTS